jgi:hypothetical protein
MCCHDHVKYPKTGTPLNIDEQKELAKRLHSCLLTNVIQCDTL